MSSSSRGIAEKDVLAIFDELDEPGEPLGTNEVAEKIPCTFESAHVVLAILADRGEIESKRIGESRAWWRSPSTTGEISTRRLETERSRRLSTQERGRIEGILEVCPVSIVIVDPSGEITFANERAEETLGLEREEITRRTYRQPEWNIYYDDGTSIPVEEHPITRVLQQGTPEYGFEHWIRLPDGIERWLSSNSAPVVDAEGAIECIVVGFEDATHLKEREDKLTSEERRVLELHSEELFQPFLDVADGEFSIEVDDVVSLSDDTALHYITARGLPARALIDVFETRFGARDVRLLRSTDEMCHVEVQLEAPTVPILFDELGGRVTSLIRSRPGDAPFLAGELPGDISPRTVIRETRRLHPDVELVSQDLQYTPRVLHDVVDDALTDRQMDVLRTAYYGDYFETPRGSTGDELAVKLGVTRQTFNQHLRKGMNIVLEQLFEASGKEAR